MQQDTLNPCEGLVVNSLFLMRPYHIYNYFEIELLTLGVCGVALKFRRRRVDTRWYVVTPESLHHILNL